MAAPCDHSSGWMKTLSTAREGSCLPLDICPFTSFFQFFFYPNSIRPVLPQPIALQQQEERVVCRVLGGELQLQAGDAWKEARQPEEMHR